MFSLFKKKEKISPESKEEFSLTEEEKLSIQQIIKNLENDLEGKNNDEQAKLFEQIGILYADLNEGSTAISKLEKSLELKLSMGDGYKKLMSLYNQKRAEAARNKDNDRIDYYMSKMDEMRNIAKKLTLSRE
ncbi:tetratricopeptide repeat protein [Streptococcus suis]|nr:tetratricopeptide repeat protein [Streptococcus suis]NQI33977.1 tetratricopeptide repeat protein [Streptococcus suis]